MQEVSFMAKARWGEAEFEHAKKQALLRLCAKMEESGYIKVEQAPKTGDYDYYTIRVVS
jgi:hypothetical protein